MLRTRESNGGGLMERRQLIPIALFLAIITATVTVSSVWAAPAQVQDTSRRLYDRVME
jgi:hypothetical protein